MYAASLYLHASLTHHIAADLPDSAVWLLASNARELGPTAALVAWEFIDSLIDCVVDPERRATEPIPYLLLGRCVLLRFLDELAWRDLAAASEDAARRLGRGFGWTSVSPEATKHWRRWLKKVTSVPYVRAVVGSTGL
jgi:hypothetical protein